MVVDVFVMGIVIVYIICEFVMGVDGDESFVIVCCVFSGVVDFVCWVFVIVLFCFVIVKGGIIFSDVVSEVFEICCVIVFGLMLFGLVLLW